MQIKFKIDDFFISLFPELEGKTNEELVDFLIDYFTQSDISPTVTIKEDVITIEIDSPEENTQTKEYKQVLALCDKQRFDEAKPILVNLIEQDSSNSEYHRVLAQIYSEQDQQDKAIDTLIDALRWNPNNGWALLLMGNILAKFKKDIQSALIYFNQALKANSEDYISLTNIAYLLLQEGKYDEAEKYINAALKINPTYPNANLTLALLYEKQGDLSKAFEQTIKSLQTHTKADQIHQGMVVQANSLAKKITEKESVSKIVSNFRHKLEFEGGKEVDLIEDNNIPTPAKIEIAEFFNHEKHALRFKSGLEAVEHLMMHELYHLKLIIDARKEQINQLFTSTEECKQEFLSDYAKHIQKMKKNGYPQESVEGVMKVMFDGLNLQIYNTPIDLFIEQYIHDEFPELRAWQFKSLTRLIEMGINAVTDPQVLQIAPAEVISKSKILNLVNSLQFKELYGLDLVNKHKPSKAELNQAKQFYNEFVEYRDNKEPAEEYEIIQHWAEDLKIDKYFELVGEIQYRKRSNMDTFIESLENDPLGIHERDPIKERAERKFQDWQDKEKGLNMAIVYYMISAIQYLNKLSDGDIKKIAYDIAMQGTLGFSPEKEGYKISLITDKEFTGTQILAWYYTSWAIAMPDKVDSLGLNFKKEYELAKEMSREE